jgi:hypothetical protein
MANEFEVCARKIASRLSIAQRRVLPRIYDDGSSMYPHDRISTYPLVRKMLIEWNGTTCGYILTTLGMQVLAVLQETNISEG